MIVVDTNIIACLLLESPSSEAAEQALRKDPSWAVPLLWRSEFRNALATAVRVGRIELSHALEVAGTAEELLEGNEFSVPSDSVLALAAESGCTAYDCEFVALARQLGVPIVTLDQQVLRAFPAHAVALDAFVSRE